MKATFAVKGTTVPPSGLPGWKGTLTCGEREIFSWLVLMDEPWPPDTMTEARRCGLEIDLLQREEVGIEI